MTAWVGITSQPRVVEVVTGPTMLQTIAQFYAEAISRAGGLPVVLPVLAPGRAVEVVDRLDALVLTGGGDVDPGAYGADPEEEIHGIDQTRDEWEFALVQAALEARLPILAICRGTQVLNVALGGTLVQHVPSATGARHGWAERFDEGVHTVRLASSCGLAALLGTEELEVNSLHHQAVATVAPGVEAVGWAPDGTIEAIEVRGHPEIVAVQWHPELLAEDPLHGRLFAAIVEAGRNRAGRRGGHR